MGTDTHDFKHLEGRPQRRSSDAKACGKLALGGQLGARSEQALAQQLLETKDQQLRNIFLVV
jgi:hypothetical protein